MFATFAFAVTIAQPKLQVWEKPVAPGLVFRQEIVADGPKVFSVLRWSPGSPTKLRPELGGGTVFEDDPTKGRETVSALALRTGAIGAINADFFPYTGDPVGLMVRDGALLSAPYVVSQEPYRARAAFGWNDRQTFWPAEPVRFRSTISVANLASSIDGWNQESDKNSLVLNTPAAGFALAKAKPNIHVVVRVTGGSPSPSGRLEGEVVRLERDLDRLAIEPGHLVLTASGTACARFAELKPGEKVRIESSLAGLEAKSLEQAVGGGPVLVRDGKPSATMAAEAFSQKDFIDKLHPRTAVGRTKSGDLLFVVVDGRQAMSAGISLPELAKWFVEHGCTDAINLDGGGSSELVLGNTIVNRPSEGAERPVANGLIFLTKLGRPAEGLSIAQDRPNHYAVLDAKGKTVPNSEVIWSCTEKGFWIDQGGWIRGTATSGTISAFCRGAVLRIKMGGERQAPPPLSPLSLP